jgi:RND family efflux transporter MFP subunit
MKKKLIPVVILLLLGLIGWQVYERLASSGKPEGRPRGTIPVAVETAPIQKMTLKDVGFFTGSLYPKSQFIVAPKIAGRLEKLFVKIGDPVKRDQLIAVLENEESLQQVDQAKAELEVGRANFQESRSSLEIARREFERAKTLRQKKIASESELDAAEAQLTAQEAKHKVTAAQVAQKEAALKAAQVRLAYTQIRASWEDGEDTRVVGERFVDEGAMLAPNASIVSVLDIRALTGVIYVIERDYSKVRIGQQASVSTDAFPGKTFPGTVVRVAPILKETSREARVEIEVPNPEGLLKPGMFIRVQIEFSRFDEATVVPISAVAKRNGQQGVFQVDMQEMTAKFVPVDLGIVNNERAQILTPQLTGQVVTLGHHLLEEGSSIILPGRGDARKKPTEKSLDGGMKQ